MAILPPGDQRRVVRPSDPEFTMFPLPAVTAIDTRLDADPNAPFGFGTGALISQGYFILGGNVVMVV